MTIDYKEQTAAGKSWQRAYQVVVNNQRGTTPSITFYEEKVIALDGGEQAGHHVGQLVEQFTDPSVTFNLLNPIDGSVVGVATYGEAYALLHSLYFHLAIRRDNPSPPPPPPDYVEPPVEEPAT